MLILYCNFLWIFLVANGCLCNGTRQFQYNRYSQNILIYVHKGLFRNSQKTRQSRHVYLLQKSWKQSGCWKTFLANAIDYGMFIQHQNRLFRERFQSIIYWCEEKHQLKKFTFALHQFWNARWFASTTALFKRHCKKSLACGSLFSKYRTQSAQ